MKSFSKNWDTSVLFLDTFCKDVGSTAIKYMCDFAELKFHEVCVMQIDHVKTTWIIDRRRKTNNFRKGTIFMLLCVPKHGRNREFTAKLFRLWCCKMERQVTKFLHVISLVMQKKFMKRAEERCNMCKLRNDARNLKVLDMLAEKLLLLFSNPTTLL